MNILYLCGDPGIRIGAQGGGAIHIRSFARALSEEGHGVTVVYASACDGSVIEDESRAAAVAAPLARWTRGLARSMQLASRLAGRTGREHPDLVRLLHNLRFARRARAAARHNPPDFVYERYSLWGIAGWWASRLLGKPLVLEVNAPLVYEQRKFRSLRFARLARWIEQTVWRGAHLVVAVSDEVRAHVERAGVAAERILVLPNGVDPKLFQPDADGASVRRQFGLEGLFVIGLSGTFKPWHGTDDLLAAFREVLRAEPAAHLLLVGDGPLRSAVEEEVRRGDLAGNVTFTGSVPHPDMPRYLAAMDAAVAPYPSLDDFYFSPLKLYEYMAAGRAIVASRTGQVERTLEHRVSALLFTPGDSRELADCLLRLARNQAFRRELGRCAREASLTHTWASNAAAVVDRLRPRAVPETAAAIPQGEEQRVS